MAPLSRLESAPCEIIEEIAFRVALVSFLGPPVALAAFLRLSTKIYKTVNKNDNPHLYARIFCRKFDILAVPRRFGDEFACASEQAHELVRRFEGLKRIRRNAYPHRLCGDELDGGLRIDMWMAYIMFLESDGNNALQLIQYARVHRFALDFVRISGRLHDGAQQNEGWVLDNEINALGVWLFWFTDHERVQLETSAEREEILAALSSLYIGSFKYGSTHLPLTYFLIPPQQVPPPPPPLSVFPLSVSPHLSPCTIPDHFNWEITLARPLLIPPVLLAYIVRFEIRAHHSQARNGWVPVGSRAPATRAERQRTGWRGATGEDYEAFSKVKTTRVDWSENTSMMHEQDWMRLRVCYDPWNSRFRDRVFTPGMLDGIWEGRWLATPPNLFQVLLHDAQAGAHLPAPFLALDFEQPMQFCLREHHQHDRNETLEFDDISLDGVGSGALRAWLPNGIRTVNREGKLRVYDSNMRHLSTYHTYNPLDAVLDEAMEHIGHYGGGVWDIILTAETDHEFGEAWGHCRFVGRVRDWDGLIVLVREASDQGRWLFRGYVHGGKNLVGRWRETATQVDAPGWEGAWSMTKTG